MSDHSHRAMIFLEFPDAQKTPLVSNMDKCTPSILQGHDTQGTLTVFHMPEGQYHGQSSVKAWKFGNQWVRPAIAFQVQTVAAQSGPAKRTST